MGVTGTLKTLSEPELDIVQNVYKIHRKTFTPSVFGKNVLNFNQKNDIRIENEHDYFNSIKKEIQDRIIGKIPETRRSILVFFEDA